MAWGVWTAWRPLTTRDRSLLVLAMTAALGRMEEFRLHASSLARTGVTDDEIDELLFQIVAYCGGPAAVAGTPRDPRLRAGTRAARSTMGAVGFVGLGNMGSALASNLVAPGSPSSPTTPPARTARPRARPTCPTSATSHAPPTYRAQPARRCGVARRWRGRSARRRRPPPMSSTPRPSACTPPARSPAARRARACRTSTLRYRAAWPGPCRTLAVMYAAPTTPAPRRAGARRTSDCRHRVGDRPGLAQAMKLANNFLSATALVATSEAIAFGVSAIRGGVLPFHLLVQFVLLGCNRGY